ncbi:hypothetical protein SAMN05443429_10213 [Cruoricaptor ignavus]|uniref:Uncharacterized protein n=1 Tax=Cruoricaptor ignavus TaxID=1118202 RepID=A0A1M6BI48_9FLAO|nr:hypothetical protein [Cruoricaptor ignavus]SHI48385.1 hypothetical protein SAMN05443429_10213 [Cruoricaptor ignavus]
MENEITINVLFGGISSILLAIVAYFVKQLHTDFKSMERDIAEVKTMSLLIKTEFKTSYDHLNQRVEHLEKRVFTIENKLLKISEHEKA